MILPHTLILHLYDLDINPNQAVKRAYSTTKAVEIRLNIMAIGQYCNIMLDADLILCPLGQNQHPSRLREPT